MSLLGLEKRIFPSSACMSYKILWDEYDKFHLGLKGPMVQTWHKKDEGIHKATGRCYLETICYMHLLPSETHKVFQEIHTTENKNSFFFLPVMKS